METERRDDGWVEILHGIDRDDRLALTGAGFLKDGDLVQVASQP